MIDIPFTMGQQQQLQQQQQPPPPPPQPQQQQLQQQQQHQSQQPQQRKPRRSIKAEGARLHSMLKDGNANVIDPSKLGKRLSSEIWHSFGAIQVDDHFSFPSIVTKTVPDGNSTVKICQFFVACSKCFSVFKYDGHAYGTTGLVKHVKNCQGNTSTIKCDHNNSVVCPTTGSLPTGTSSNSITLNDPPPSRRRKDTTPGSSTTNKPNSGSPAALRYLTKLVEETRSDLKEVKQKVNDLMNLLSVPSHQVGQIQIISNDGNTVENDTNQ